MIMVDFKRTAITMNVRRNMTAWNRRSAMTTAFVNWHPDRIVAAEKVAAVRVAKAVAAEREVVVAKAAAARRVDMGTPNLALALVLCPPTMDLQR